MFFKVTKGKNKNYLYLVEVYRDKDKKVKHKTLASLGAIDQLDKNFVESFIKSTSLVLEDKKMAIIDSSKAYVSQNINWGALSLVKQL